MKDSVSRRRLLHGIGATSALLAVPTLAFSAPVYVRGVRGDPRPSDLFSLGVASGDPHARSVVMWTRLAPDPLNGGGMPSRVVRVKFRVARDPGLRDVVQSGVTLAGPHDGHAVHVTVTGLEPNTWYWYQFEAQGARSRVGRTRTFPDALHDVAGMRFAVVSCQDYAAGYYPAYRDMVGQGLDFVVHTGDYIYEYPVSGTPLLAGREHLDGEIFSVQDYRNRYALYRLDPDLQDAHAALPFLCTWDDHEVDNNYAGLIAEEVAPFTGAAFVERRRNAYQVYRETMPLRPGNRLLTAEGALRIYREFRFGRLASLYMLDTRQYRSDQPAGDNFGSTDPDSLAVEPIFGERLFDADGIANPAATLLGTEQEHWLAGRLAASRTRWNVLAQQVMLMPWNLRAAGRKQVELNPALPPDQKAVLLGLVDKVANIYNVDAWDGYAAAQRRLLELVAGSGASNPIIVTGDIHSAWGANLLKDFGDPDNSDLVAAEFVCTSISSTFLQPDPRPTDFIVRASLPDNAHISYFSGLFRGYCLCDVNRSRWQTTYRAVLGDLNNPDPLALVPQPDSQVGTDRVLSIEAGFNVPGSGKRVTVG